MTCAIAITSNLYISYKKKNKETKSRGWKDEGKLEREDINKKPRQRIESFLFFSARQIKHPSTCVWFNFSFMFMILFVGFNFIIMCSLFSTEVEDEASQMISNNILM
jgi:hypothetical protein